MAELTSIYLLRIAFYIESLDLVGEDHSPFLGQFY